jgi:hypothetical protein
MKLKTRLILAYAEFTLAAGVLIVAVATDLMSPRGLFGLPGIGISAALSALLFGPICYSSWKRLRKTRAQLAELGPDGPASADLWVAPRVSGVIGAMILVAALAFALAPALLTR